MNIETLAQALEELDLRHIERALVCRPRARRRWLMGAVLAACLCAALVFLPQGQTALGVLPVLEVTQGTTGGMGFEGVLLYNVSQLDTGTPWRAESSPASLPVWRNGCYNRMGHETGLSKGEMDARLERAAAALGTELSDYTYTREGFTPSGLLPFAINSVSARGEGMELGITANGTLTVKLDSGLPLPEGDSFTLYDTDDVQAARALGRVTERFSTLLDFEQPQAVLAGDYIMWNSYDENGKYHVEPRFEREYWVYDAAGDDTWDLLNFTFRRARFYPDDAGELYIIRLYDGLASAEFLGDYPLITLEEAFGKLLAGEYLTNVPYEISDGVQISGGELTYRTGSDQKILMPYYRFYVELPEMRREDGPTDYGAFYVPAVQEQFLKWS